MFIFKAILFLSGNLKQKAVKQALFAERDRADPPPGPAAPAAPAGPSLTRARGVGAAGPARAPPGAPERGCGDTAPPPGGAPRGQPNAGPAPHPATQTRPKHPFLPGETAARTCCAVLLHGTATRFDTQPQKPTQRHPEPSGGAHAGNEHKHGKKEIILPNFFTCFTSSHGNTQNHIKKLPVEMSMCLSSSSHWVSPPAQRLQTPHERKNILKSPNLTRKKVHELYLTQMIWYDLTPLLVPGGALSTS